MGYRWILNTLCRYNLKGKITKVRGHKAYPNQRKTIKKTALLGSEP